ncbi:hypothetical protein [Clostridium nigeriense]|uniref:hypothetical protein n=1 Tax=Clostridium nigeriense TaxID=1805470 RepID=UPI000835D679|nr:hypothetical protein [Clostridium nigeriense]
MKICSKCGEVNNNDNLICSKCNLSNKFFIDYDEEVLKSQKNIKRSNRIKKYTRTILCIVAILLLLLLILLNCINKTLTYKLVFEVALFSIIGLVLIKFTEEVFIITHILSISNIDKNQMSDIYNILIKIIGIINIFFSASILIKALLL